MTIDPHNQLVKGFNFTAKDCQNREQECEADFTYTHSGLGESPFGIDEIRDFKTLRANGKWEQVQPCHALSKALVVAVELCDAIAEAEVESGKDYPDPMDDSAEPRERD